MSDACARWGLPDWHDARAYPDAGDAIRVWGWEFLRRRTDYREVWSAVAARAELAWDGSVSTAISDDYDALRRTYGMSRVVDPAARLSLFQVAQLLDFKAWGYGVGYRSIDRADADRAAGQAAIMFDLHRAVAPQIDAARSYLNRIQAEMAEAPISPKNRQDNWPTFLRVLDARECDATFAYIAKTLWPGQDKSPQSGRDTLKAALAVQERAPFFL